jgi:hypothetical protein
MTNVIFSVGGIKFKDLVKILADKFEMTVAKTKSLADTAMTTYFRAATGRALEKIQQDVPEIKLKYESS